MDDDLVICFTKDSNDKFLQNVKLESLRSIVDKHLVDKQGTTLWHWYEIDYNKFKPDLDEFLSDIGINSYIRFHINSYEKIMENDGDFWAEPFCPCAFISIVYDETDCE